MKKFAIVICLFPVVGCATQTTHSITSLTSHKDSLYLVATETKSKTGMFGGKVLSTTQVFNKCSDKGDKITCKEVLVDFGTKQDD